MRCLVFQSILCAKANFSAFSWSETWYSKNDLRHEGKNFEQDYAERGGVHIIKEESINYKAHTAKHAKKAS